MAKAKLQLSLRRLLLAVAAVAVLIAAVFELDARIEDLSANGYRVQAAGDLLVDYMKDSGKWPEGWNDLTRFVEHHKSELQYRPNIQDLRSHVRIDFDFDPTTVDLRSEWSDNNPQLIVVSSTYGRTSGATRNPNHFVYAYLRGGVQ